jgi:Periplasmic binding protein
VIGPLSGPFALQGKNFKAAIDAYFALNGNKVGGNTIEIVYRDLPEADPAKSRALGQELIIKEKVQYLAGVYFTPEALALTPLLEQQIEFSEQILILQRGRIAWSGPSETLRRDPKLIEPFIGVGIH